MSDGAQVWVLMTVCVGGVLTLLVAAVMAACAT